MFKKIDHVEIVTDQLDRTVDFYTDVLGFKLKARDRIDRSSLGVPLQLVYLELGGTSVELMAYEGGSVAPAPADEHLGYRMMALEVTDMQSTIDYLKPARLDETIEVVTSCGELRGASLDMIQQARRGEEILVRAEIVVACMGAGGRPVRLPQHLRTALAQVSAGGPPRSRHIRV